MPGALRTVLRVTEHAGAMLTPRLVPELSCSDIDRSLRFYTEVLGFTVLYARLQERFAYLDREGAHLMIEQPTGRTFVVGQLEYPYGRGMNLQIEVSDVVSLYERVKASGSKVYLHLEDRWYRRDQILLGNRQFVVLDPDGYLLRIFEDIGQRFA
jgi:catechol 2,3-dioxygenase-like lactoylglutathione lyase family enzyme